MGYGFPAAMGAQAAFPNRLVLCISGDGSFQMNTQELATAVIEKLPVKIFVINNRFHGMVRQWQDLFYEGRYASSYLGNVPDFVKLAEAYGAAGVRIEKVGMWMPAFKKPYPLIDQWLLMSPCINMKIAIP